MLQCQQCAENIKQALIAAGHQGQQIELREGAGKPFIVCLSYDGGKITITENGRHVAIRVGDVVFDNLHPDGMQYGVWLADFDSRGGVAIHRVDEF